MRNYNLKISEPELIAKIKNKESVAFDIIYQNYSKSIYSIILKIVKTNPPASDILQDSFVKIWKNIDKYDTSKGTLFTWILNISRNTSIDSIRSSSSKVNKNTFDIDNKNAKIESFETQNENFDLKNLLLNLELKHREIIDLLYFQGYTQAEVAEYLDIPLGTVKTRVKYAMNALRYYLRND